MSVPSWKRKSNEDLDLFLATKDMAKYILKITRNPKIFKPEFKVEITDRLINDSMNIFMNVWKANNIHLYNFPQTRADYQNAALMDIVDFLCTWDLARCIFHLKHNRIETVIEGMLNFRDAIKKWMNSDIERVVEKQSG